jgi:hypothetical protein
MALQTPHEPPSESEISNAIGKNCNEGIESFHNGLVTTSITARLCRRFFGVYSYTYFGRSGFFHEGSSQASLAGHVHWHLGHAVLGGEVIAY